MMSIDERFAEARMWAEAWADERDITGAADVLRVFDEWADLQRQLGEAQERAAQWERDVAGWLDSLGAPDAPTIRERVRALEDMCASRNIECAEAQERIKDACAVRDQVVAQIDEERRQEAVKAIKAEGVATGLAMQLAEAQERAERTEADAQAMRDIAREAMQPIAYLANEWHHWPDPTAWPGDEGLPNAQKAYRILRLALLEHPGAALLADARKVARALATQEWAGRAVEKAVEQGGVWVAVWQPTCPACGGWPLGGHGPSCPIGNALRIVKARGWLEEEPIVKLLPDCNRCQERHYRAPCPPDCEGKARGWLKEDKSNA